MLPGSNLDIVKRFRNSLVQFYIDEKLYFTSKNIIYQISDLKNPKPVEVARIPWPLPKTISKIRLLDRFFENSILQLHKTKNGEFLVMTGNDWWHIDKKGISFKIERFSDTKPMFRGFCESQDGTIYIAEYLRNLDRGQIRIFKTKDLSNFDVAWIFPKGAIRHVHGLIVDLEIKNRIWVLTGDLDNESHIYYTDDEFSSLETFLSLGQISRATDLITHNGLLYWGMDTPLETSFIIKADKKNPRNFEKLYELPGPVYYLCQNKAGAIYVGTTVEPGPALKDDYGHIFALRPDNSWFEIIRYKSDIIPQHGIFYFPRGILPENILVFSQRALNPFEGYMTIAIDKAVIAEK